MGDTFAKHKTQILQLIPQVMIENKPWQFPSNVITCNQNHKYFSESLSDDVHQTWLMIYLSARC